MLVTSWRVYGPELELVEFALDFNACRKGSRSRWARFVGLPGRDPDLRLRHHQSTAELPFSSVERVYEESVWLECLPIRCYFFAGKIVGLTMGKTSKRPPLDAL